jgi:hypothetical protein
MDEKIETFLEEIADLRKQFNSTVNEMKGGQSGKSAVSKELRQHYDEFKKWND